MAYNHGREDRKWRIWKEAEEKLLRECGVDEATIEQIRMADRETSIPTGGFTDGRMTLREYLEDMAGRERQAEVGTVAELLEEIESENLYQVLVTVDGRTLKIVLLKMQGYSDKGDCPACAFDDWCHLCEVRPSAEEAAKILYSSKRDTTVCEKNLYYRNDAKSRTEYIFL